jgi:hypothetical protein
VTFYTIIIIIIAIVVITLLPHAFVIREDKGFFWMLFRLARIRLKPFRITVISG